MDTDAVAGIVVTYTYRDRIGLVQALACHPLPRMCSLSQGLLSKWRTELINEETPIERRPLLRSPAQYFNRYSIPIYRPWGHQTHEMASAESESSSRTEVMQDNVNNGLMKGEARSRA